MKIARDKAMRFKKKMEKESARYKDLARAALAKKQKPKALMFLKLKKYQQTHIDKVDAQLFKLHEMVSTIEWETQNVEFLNGLQAGTRALEQLHEQVSVEDAERIMDDSADAIARQNEIDEMLAGGLSTEDDAAVLEELAAIEALEADALAVELPDAPVDAAADAADIAARLPDAPTGDLDATADEIKGVPAAAAEEEGEGRVLVAA